MQTLNEAQLAAVSHGDGPLLIVAGAGTGKTTTLAHRVAHLVRNGAIPERILLLTFTRRAAAEMLNRARLLLAEGRGGPGGDRMAHVWGGTFHAVGTRLLRIYGSAVGLPPNFTIIDRGDQEDLMNFVRSEVLDAKTDKKRFPKKGTCVSIYSRCINAQKKLFDILKDYYPKLEEFRPELAKLFDAYAARKIQDATLDYDDLLLYWDALLKAPDVSARIRGRFDWVLVDEYQDTNLIQASILSGLTPEGRGLTVVGDDAQSIYSFRAATVRNILDIPRTFPGTTIVPLEENYRSTETILRATNRVVGQLRERFRKELFSTRGEGATPEFVRCDNEDAQSAFVADTVLRHYEEGIPLREQAVLFRSGSHSLRLEAELNRRRIPYIKYGGLKFTESAHVKDLLSFLRLAENPADRPAGVRMLALLPGIGPKKARDLMVILHAAGGDFAAWRSWNPPKAAAERWPALVQTLLDIRPQERPVSEQLSQALDFYKPRLFENYPMDGDARFHDLEQLVDMGGKYRRRQEMLADFALDPPQSSEGYADKPDIDDDYLVLSTIHSAKGLEWRAVHIIHASDGNIPSDFATGRPEDVDEELRLFYVAMTRAKDFLYVSCPMKYFHLGPSWGAAFSQVLPTRFLPKDILRDCFLQCLARDASLEDDYAPGEQVLADEHMTAGDWFHRQTEDLW